MKKIIAFLFTLSLTFILCACNTKSLCLLYNGIEHYNGFAISINKLNNCCFVGEYTCEQYTDNMEITIPDEYNGVPIERIGGYYGTGVPTPFAIDIKEFMNAEEGSIYNGVYGEHPDNFDIKEKYTVKDISFRLNIGKNINTIDNVSMNNYYPHINKDGSITFYHPVVEIICSDENEHFYSNDGKLYNKKTNELITEFAYNE